MARALVPMTVALLVLASGSASASFPGTNGLIAREEVTPGGATIGTVNADGTGARPGVVATGPADRDASWSPDGRRLAFTSTRDGNEEVYVLDLESGIQTRLTVDPARDHDPAFSADGTAIAFASERDGDSEIYVMPAAGGPARRLTSTPGEDRQPAWSSAGLIAFASNRTGDFELYVMDGQGGGVRQVATIPGADLDPSWSPDGAALAFTSMPAGGVFDVYRVNADGQNLQPLATTTNVEHFPTWSPDGTRIAFAMGGEAASQIAVMPAEGQLGGLPRLIASGTDPNWAPMPPPVAGPDQGASITVAASDARVLVAPATTEPPARNEVLQAQLRTTVEVPVGTTIDATAGTVEIDAVTTTPEGPGQVGHASVRYGIFTVTQDARNAGEPTLTLVPGPRPCPEARAAIVADAHARIRIRSRGRFRTVGGYGRAAGRGTEWVMRDRCDGTSFKVLEDTIRVRDFRRKRTVTVRGGRCYLAAVERRRDARRPKRTCPRIRPPG